MSLKGSCIDLSLTEQKVAQNLLCGICFQLMINPCRVSCGSNPGHYFGNFCIEKWKKQGKGDCPFCRKQFDQLAIDKQKSQEAAKISVKCKSCSQLLMAKDLKTHLLKCQKYYNQLKCNLLQYVNQQKQILSLEITPHLKQSHLEIFNEHVKEWDWLDKDVKDWKWWWWCNQPWWNNTSCQPCNDLWHKYQNEVDKLESHRIQILTEINDLKQQ